MKGSLKQIVKNSWGFFLHIPPPPTKFCQFKDSRQTHTQYNSDSKPLHYAYDIYEKVNSRIRNLCKLLASKGDMTFFSSLDPQLHYLNHQNYYGSLLQEQLISKLEETGSLHHNSTIIMAAYLAKAANKYLWIYLASVPLASVRSPDDLIVVNKFLGCNKPI